MNRSMSLSFRAARGSAACAVAVPACRDETVATGGVDETAAPDNVEAGVEVVAIAMATVSAVDNTWPPDPPRGCSVCMSVLHSRSELAAPCYGRSTADADPAVGSQAVELQ